MFWDDWPSFTEWAHHWQELLGSLVGAIAGLIAVLLTIIFTLRSETRRDKRETATMTRALLSEMWGYAGRALQAHQKLSDKLRSGGSITVHELEDTARFPAPVIYPNVAGKLGGLGEDAHQVIHFYGRLQSFGETIEHILRNFYDRRIGLSNPEDLVEHLLMISETAAPLLPRLRQSLADAQADLNFATAVGQARKRWELSKLSSELSPGRCP